MRISDDVSFNEQTDRQREREREMKKGEWISRTKRIAAGINQATSKKSKTKTIIKKKEKMWFELKSNGHPKRLWNLNTTVEGLCQANMTRERMQHRGHECG